MLEKKEAKNYPDLSDCEILWEKYRTPERVIGHCRAVSKTAATIGLGLNKNGFSLNIPLIESAGWLHDIARVDPEHWIKGAQVANSLGCFDVADIIEVHMFYSIDASRKEITETDLVCLADRMVKEDHFVGPDERMDYILEKAKNSPGAEERIRCSFLEIKALKLRIEQIIGCSIEDLMCSE